MLFMVVLFEEENSLSILQVLELVINITSFGEVSSQLNADMSSFPVHWQRYADMCLINFITNFNLYSYEKDD